MDGPWLSRSWEVELSELQTTDEFTRKSIWQDKCQANYPSVIQRYNLQHNNISFLGIFDVSFMFAGHFLGFELSRTFVFNWSCHNFEVTLQVAVWRLSPEIFLVFELRAGWKLSRQRKLCYCFTLCQNICKIWSNIFDCFWLC